MGSTKRVSILIVSLVLAGGLAAYLSAGETPATDWSMNATIIEACSCPMFCQCYFNTSPAGHHHHGEAEHFCRFNNALRVNHGHYGETDLAGAKFWVAGDLGSNWAEGKMDWAVLHFDPAVTPEQRAGIQHILPHLYTAEWGSFTVGEAAPIEWKAEGDMAVARLGEGKMAEVVLHGMQGMTDEPVVLTNLQYWGAQTNEGFVMMPNEVEAYRVGDKAFEYKGTNGFMITLEVEPGEEMAKETATGR